MRALLIAATALALVGCNSTERKAKMPKATASNGMTMTPMIAGTDSIETAIIQDSTGCQWIVFKYRGYGVSTEERKRPNPAGPAAPSIQVCDGRPTEGQLSAVAR